MSATFSGFSLYISISSSSGGPHTSTFRFAFTACCHTSMDVISLTFVSCTHATRHFARSSGGYTQNFGLAWWYLCFTQVFFCRIASERGWAHSSRLWGFASWGGRRWDFGIVYTILFNWDSGFLDIGSYVDGLKDEG